jgi:quercetin dioxygenase-like cupin family protein
MSDQSPRLRQHPDERFQPAQHAIDLREAAARLQAEPPAGQRKHRQETLYRHSPMTVALFLFEPGAHMLPHAAEGVVTVHVLSGRIKMNAEGQAHTLNAGQILLLAPGVQHDVLAEEASQMLLTVCLATAKPIPPTGAK